MKCHWYSASQMRKTWMCVHYATCMIIRLISVDEKGNTTFTVVGYMNRGVHEGQVGVAVYYFDAEKNSVTEKAFVPSEDGYYLMKEDLGKFVYYSNSDENLYVMIDGTLYLVNLKDNTREVLVKDLEEGQYQVSPDGHLLAYQSEGGKINESQKIIVLNLKTGKSFDITSEGDEYVKPIGFIHGMILPMACCVEAMQEPIYPDRVCTRCIKWISSRRNRR